MSDELEALERRARSMHGIRSVVHTMKTLSAINAAPCEQAAIAITEYLDVVIVGLQALLHASPSMAMHTQPGEARNRIVLALGTDHGLCGNYNELVAKQVARQLGTAFSSNSASGHEDISVSSKGGTGADNDPGDPSRTDNSTTDSNEPGRHRIICVGAQLDDALEDVGLASDKVLFAPSNTDGLIRLAANLVAETDRLSALQPGALLSVQLVFTESEGNAQQQTTARTLLPVPETQLAKLKSSPWPSTSRPWFRQTKESLFAALLRNYLFASICRAAAEAMMTENAARLSRMRQAEDAVDDQLDSLSERTRSARQTRITEELQDVISGFEASSEII